MPINLENVKGWKGFSDGAKKPTFFDANDEEGVTRHKGKFSKITLAEDKAGFPYLAIELIMDGDDYFTEKELKKCGIWSFSAKWGKSDSNIAKIKKQIAALCGVDPEDTPVVEQHWDDCVKDEKSIAELGNKLDSLAGKEAIVVNETRKNKKGNLRSDVMVHKA